MKKDLVPYTPKLTGKVEREPKPRTFEELANQPDTYEFCDRCKIWHLDGSLTMCRFEDAVDALRYMGVPPYGRRGFK